MKQDKSASPVSAATAVVIWGEAKGVCCERVIVLATSKAGHQCSQIAVLQRPLGVLQRLKSPQRSS